MCTLDRPLASDDDLLRLFATRHVRRREEGEEGGNVASGAGNHYSIALMNSKITFKTIENDFHFHHGVVLRKNIAEMRARNRPARATKESSMPPNFFFSGPTKTLLAVDEGQPIAGSLRDRERLLEDCETALRCAGARPSALVGAVPFCDRASVRLFCSSQVSVTGPWSVTHDPLPKRATVPLMSTEGDTRADPFLESVRRAVSAIQRGEMRKVVLSRVRDVPLTGKPDVARLLRSLRHRNPHGFTFALRLGDGVLVGASPELLVSRRGTRLVSSPLAGSRPRSADPVEDARRAEALLRSPKDRHEHQLVTEQIVESLRPFARNLRSEREPLVIRTAAMWHLSTRIEGTLRDRDVSSLRLALSLHPTPAVCGTPTQQARSFIQSSETFDRGYFTGTLGHMDASGDGDWIVTIRCAEVSETRARVFAGAGIVENSVAELELNETDAKMRTMLDALGLEGAA